MPRDSARLLEVSGGAIDDHLVSDLPRLLRPGDLLVFNDTRVIPAQLEGKKGEARIGATLHKREGPRDWRAFIRNARRLADGDRIDFGAGVAAVATEKAADGSVLLHFEGEEPVELLLERAGRMPLPPYIAGRRAADARDRDDYQTMFAREQGAVAAPTAALHFTPRLMAALAEAGIGHETLTLHVGAGTFLPVKAEDTADHVMHSEWGRISADAAERLNRARAGGGRIVPVGTTALAPARKRRRRSGQGARVRRRHRDLHHPRLPLPRGRRPRHQLPSAALDPVHARLGADGLGDDESEPMRMPSRAATASIPMAMRACCCRPRRRSRTRPRSLR